MNNALLLQNPEISVLVKIIFVNLGFVAKVLENFVPLGPGQGQAQAYVDHREGTVFKGAWVPPWPPLVQNRD